MDIARIGRFISEERQAKGLTQKDLASLLRVSDKTISRWETGKGLPDPSSWLSLGEALGITVNELLAGKRSREHGDDSAIDRTLVETTQYVKRRTSRRLISRTVLIAAGIAMLVYIGLIVRDQVQLRGSYGRYAAGMRMILIEPSYFVPGFGTWQYAGTKPDGSIFPKNPYFRLGNALWLHIDSGDEQDNEHWDQYEIRPMLWSSLGDYIFRMPDIG